MTQVANNEVGEEVSHLKKSKAHNISELLSNKLPTHGFTWYIFEGCLQLHNNQTKQWSNTVPQYLRGYPVACNKKFGAKAGFEVFFPLTQVS